MNNLNSLNLKFMNEIFSAERTKGLFLYNINLINHTYNQVRIGRNSLKTLGPKFGIISATLNRPRN